MVTSEADQLLKKTFDALSRDAASRTTSQDLLLEVASYLRTKGIVAYASYPKTPKFTLMSVQRLR
jgi:hypothetical protein